MKWFPTAVMLLALTAPAPLLAQEKKATESLTLSQAAEQLGKKVRDLQQQLPPLIQTILDDAEDNDAAKTLLARAQEAVDVELQQQHLLTLQLVLGSSATGVKSTQGWLAHAEKVRPRLPQGLPRPELPDLRAVDQHVQDTPAQVETSPQALGQYLGRAGKTDLEKAYAVYTWMVKNLAYDKDSFLSGKIDSDVLKVLTLRRGVCGGLAKTYETLGLFANLKVWVVNGHLRLPMAVPGPKYPLDYKTTLGTFYGQHGWNALLINDKMYLVDPTQGLGQTYRQGKKVQDHLPTYDYFLVPPEMALPRLAPREERWQLLKTPLKKKDHEALSVLGPGYYAAGARLQSHPYPVAVTRGQLLLTLEIPAREQVYGGMRPIGKEGPLVPMLMQRQGDQLIFRAGFPQPGSYELQINLGDEELRYRSTVVHYRVEAKAVAPEPPKGFGKFQKLQGSVYYPLSRKVAVGTTQYFAVRLPGASKASLLTDKGRLPMQQRGDLFVAQANLEAGTVRVDAVLDDPRRWSGMLEFTAE
jgi:hypothetical protein